MFTIPEKDRKRFQKSLEALHTLYDDDWRGIRHYLEKANYHTNLACSAVHSTRDSLVYAVALLDSGEEENRVRAIRILENMVTLQDTDPASPSFGIWSWYMEEPLEKMSPPDWNWADFCGKELLQVAMHHRERIPETLLSAVKNAIYNACLSIFRRNMHCGYTNISIMGAYVTLCAGEFFGWDLLFRYGKSRLRRHHDFLRKNGAFAEYNSATYTVVATEELTRIFADIRDPEVHTIAEDMLDLAWRTIAEHFHAPTKQWCGPNARSYSWLLSSSALSFVKMGRSSAIPFIQMGLQDTARLIDEELFEYDLEWAHIPLCCPEKYRSSFTECTEHDVNLAFYDGIGKLPTSIAVSYVGKNYTLSSWEAQDTWNQRRNLLGYWGGDAPRFINATFLHNLYDFASGVLTTAQLKGSALTTVSLWTDGGDTHCNLDLIRDRRITAYDLRLRIELGGELSAAPVLDAERGIATLSDGGQKIYIKLLGGCFDGSPVNLSLGDTASDMAVQATKPDMHRRFASPEDIRYYLDVIFYSGPEREFDLGALSSAYTSLLVSMDGIAEEFVSLVEKDGRVTAAAQLDGVLLETESPAAPCAVKSWKGHSRINGTPLGKLYPLPKDIPAGSNYLLV